MKIVENNVKYVKITTFDRSFFEKKIQNCFNIFVSGVGLLSKKFVTIETDTLSIMLNERCIRHVLRDTWVSLSFKVLCNWCMPSS